MGTWYVTKNKEQLSFTIVLFNDMHLESNARLPTCLKSSLLRGHLRDIVQIRFHAVLIA